MSLGKSNDPCRSALANSRHSLERALREATDRYDNRRALTWLRQAREIKAKADELIVLIEKSQDR